MSYRMIVGLGNPGSEYANTRHNVGFRVLDAFAQKHGAEAWRKDRKLKGEIAVLSSPKLGKLTLVKPSTYMNESGVCVQKVCSFYKVLPEELVVVYDEINLAVGDLKLSVSGSAGGHNGLADILDRIPARFARLRVGIGGKPDKETPLADYVLGKFSDEEEPLVLSSLNRSVESLELLLSLGSERAMNQINRKSKNDDSNSI